MTDPAILTTDLVHHLSFFLTTPIERLDGLS